MTTENILGQIEALLFVAGKPLSFKEIAATTLCDQKEIKQKIEELNAVYTHNKSGLRCIITGNKAQLFTAPDFDELVNTYLEEERQSELTKPSLETLSIIAYRGPVSKEEMERIRGINCSLIIRNLLIRGLINEIEKDGQKFYEITHDFLKNLGASSVAELPDYEELSQHESIEHLLDLRKEQAEGE